MHGYSRRDFLKSTGMWGASTLLAASTPAARAFGSFVLAEPLAVVHPRMRVPASFIIDDSTCLVNMGRFCMPQFATAWPDRDAYKKPWKSWPVEIPDSFVREFGEWCAEQGVKGKYSLVPNPACVGWLDRELPGWSRRELLDSLKLVRELMVPNWDIHPEMITHTRVIDVRTGRPLEEISAATMENSFPQAQISVDELTAYIAYALKILRNCDLPCEGITTPGGFGNRVKSELSLAVQQAVGDVYGAEIPHYFKYIAGDDESTAPKIEHLRRADDAQPDLTVSVFAGTGDWFGGWDGDEQPQPDRYCNRDATAGKMVELIERNEPAVMLCHWPGMYTQGTKAGFAALQQVITALNQHRADEIIWMKPSEMARYQAAKELTRMQRTGNELRFNAPFACPDFTIRISQSISRPPALVVDGKSSELRRVAARKQLSSGTWLANDDSTVLCFDLPQGASLLNVM